MNQVSKMDSYKRSGSLPPTTRDEVFGAIQKRLGLSNHDPFYEEFEAVRLTEVLKQLREINADGSGQIRPRMLDFGYLKGLVPSTILAFVPLDYWVIDHPKAGVFQDSARQIEAKNMGVTLTPCALEIRSEVDRVLEALGKFDVVLLGEIIEHLDPTTTAHLLSRIAGCLRPRGVLIVTTPNLFAIANIARHLIGKDVQAIPLGHSEMIQGHIHLWSPSLLMDLGRELGFQKRSLFYFHGLEGTQYVLSTRHWKSLGFQVWHKALRLLSTMVSRWKGFFVVTFSKK